MERMVPPVKAWLITEANASTLSFISGIEEKIFIANTGWVLVEDWNHHRRFMMIPKTSFKRSYPSIELTLLKGENNV